MALLLLAQIKQKPIGGIHIYRYFVYIFNWSRQPTSSSYNSAVMIYKQMKLMLTASMAIVSVLNLHAVEAYMSPMMMSPMGGPGAMLNPMNPYGYHVQRRRRHRNIFQRLTGTGRRYNYSIRPNSYMSGMYPRMGMGMGMASPMGMGMSSPMGIGGVRTTTVGYSTGMSPMGMGSVGMSSMGMGMPAATAMAMGGGMKNFRNAVRTDSALSHACRSNDTNSLRHVSCPYMNQRDLHYCFTRASDSFLSALVKKCKGVFTSNPYQLTAYGVEMILANKTMPFGSLVTRNTCLMLGSYEKKTLLKTAILARTPNSYAFVDHILNTCKVPLYLLANLQSVALVSGDMQVTMRLQRASMYPVSHHHVQRVFYAPSGRIINLRFDGALSVMSGRDMGMFGKIGKSCSMLRPEHITHPLFNPELLSEMSENCFRHLRPRLFWYMTSDMIKRFRWWKSAKPSQIHWIPIGKPIQAVPFFILGQHPYINKLDRSHPCAGITKTQRISIMMEPKTARAFFERCRASSAFAVKASASLLISALLAYLAFVS